MWPKRKYVQIRPMVLKFIFYRNNRLSIRSSKPLGSFANSQSISIKEVLKVARIVIVNSLDIDQNK